MSKLQKKWIASDAVDGTKFKLLNDQYMRARNAGDSADVNLVKLNSSDKIEFASVPQVSSNPTVDNDLARKLYVDSAVSSAVSALANGMEWQDSALDYVTDNTVIPLTEVSGDRYILAHNGGAPHVDWDGATAGDIVEFDGSVWVAITPSTGMMIVADDAPSLVYLWSGSAWVAKSFESTTAGSATSLNGLAVDVNVDDSTIEVSSNALRVKDAGITEAKLASGVDAETFLIATGYDASTAAGNVAVSDSIQVALEKIEKKADDAASASANANRMVITLTGTDITNGYVDLAHPAVQSSIEVTPKGAPLQEFGVDFTLSVPVTNTRVTFAGDLSANLASGDKLIIHYLY